MAFAQPGIHPNLEIWHFEEVEKKIIKKLSKEWLVTNGDEFKLGQSSNFRYCLLKPTNHYREMFNLEREVPVIFSPHPDLQPRVFDAIEYVNKKLPDLRIERICTVIFSLDPNCEKKMSDILKQDQESQIIIPLNTAEYLTSSDPFYLENKFRKHFYTRDLFAFESPLKLLEIS